MKSLYLTFRGCRVAIPFSASTVTTNAVGMMITEVNDDELDLARWTVLRFNVHCVLQGQTTHRSCYVHRWNLILFFGIELFEFLKLNEIN